MRLAAPALAYFGLVFAIGFGLGAVRMFWLAPQVGALMAGVIELPVILFASWLVATWLVRHSRLRRAAARSRSGRSHWRCSCSPNWH